MSRLIILHERVFPAGELSRMTLVGSARRQRSISVRLVVIRDSLAGTTIADSR